QALFHTALLPTLPCRYWTGISVWVIRGVHPYTPSRPGTPTIVSSRWRYARPDNCHARRRRKIPEAPWLEHDRERLGVQVVDDAERIAFGHRMSDLQPGGQRFPIRGGGLDDDLALSVVK